MRLPGLKPQPVELGLVSPVMLVVVDTEEEFNWGQPFNRKATDTRSIPAQDRVHAIYDRMGVVPTYVVDYPVATSAPAAQYLRRLVDAGRAEFGTHCHPWVTPPYSEKVSSFNSTMATCRPNWKRRRSATARMRSPRPSGAPPGSSRPGVTV